MFKFLKVFFSQLRSYVHTQVLYCFYIRNDTLHKWHDKTRLFSKKLKSFSAFDIPVLKQIDQVLVWLCVFVEFGVIDVYMGNLYNIGTDHWIYPIQKKLNNIKHLLQHS